MSYRWLLLGTLVAALVVTSYGIWIAAWIDVPDFATVKMERGAIEQVPRLAWMLAVMGMIFVGYGLFRGAVPGTSAFLTAVVSLAGAVAMFLLTRNIGDAAALDRFSNKTPVTVATGAWLTIAGFVVAALASLSLWRIRPRGSAAE